eukprot:8625529-Lingulodinium_polyedra.AAC.1
MWCPSADISEEREAPASVFQFRGAVRDLAQYVGIADVAAGGRLAIDRTGQNSGPAPYLMASPPRR